MIGSLRGKVSAKSPPSMMLEVHGVGYELEAPMTTFYKLPEIGVEVLLYTHLVVREDAQALFGFIAEHDRALFRSLIKVNGVGPKLALTILSGIDAEEFFRCVKEHDTASLVRLPGIGKKTAERLIIEMRDRIPENTDDSTRAAPIESLLNSQTNPSREAVSALVSLGYKPPEANKMVNAIAVEGKNSEDLIRLALQSAI